jgi:hypothetical protein
MIEDTAIQSGSSSKISTGVGWSMITASKDDQQSDDDDRVTSPDVKPKAFVSGAVDQALATDASTKEPTAKKRKLHEAEMESLRDQTFCDSTDPSTIPASNGSSTPNKMGRFQAMRTTADIPSEGAGLRGKDADVDEEMQVDKSNATTSLPLLAGAQSKLCIRHQRMADEGTTAKLQKVSTVENLKKLLGSGSSHLAPHCSISHEHGRCRALYR